MPVRVNIPNLGAVHFPDGMSVDDIHSAVDSIYSQQIAANPPAAARPNVNMQPSGLAPSYDENQRAAGVAGMAGGSPNLFSATPGYTAAVGIPAGIAAVGASGSALAGTAAAAVLAPIAKKYGIKALEGAGLGLGYDLYRELKKVYGE